MNLTWFAASALLFCSLAPPTLAGDIKIKGKVEFQAKPDKKPGSGEFVTATGSWGIGNATTTGADGSYLICLPCNGNGGTVEIEVLGEKITFPISIADCVLGTTISGVDFCFRVCPCGPLGTPTVIDCCTDSKGNTYTQTCTNASNTGDFVWTCKAPGGPEKVIGRCIFVGGQNTTLKVPVDGGDWNDRENQNLAYHLQECCDGGRPDGQPWDKVIFAFDAKKCELKLICYKKDDTSDTGYTETDRKCIEPDILGSARTLEEGLEILNNCLWGDKVPPPVLENDTNGTHLVSRDITPEEGVIAWDIVRKDPILRPDDYILISGLTPDDLLWWDESYDLKVSGQGVRFYPRELVQPNHGSTLLRYRPIPCSGIDQSYSIVQAGSKEFWTEIYEGRRTSIDTSHPLLSGASAMGPIELHSRMMGRPYCTPMPNSTGRAALMEGIGSECLAQQDLVLRVSNVPTGSSGNFFLGTSRDYVPLGSGMLCVGGPLMHFPNTQSSSLGTMQQRVDLTRATENMVGVTLHFSAWFRDSGNAQLNFANGLTVTLKP